ncbi:hypothetical protein [Xenorhabdus bovienii]|uniref:hypothetical protein n=1 Tax=Xenorhabdus bovienii TaxID=40576 RepID=UPI003DA4F783
MRNKKGKNTKNKESIYPFEINGDVLSVCNSIIEFLDENEITEHPDYYISKAILARENKEYLIERQSVLHLLFFIEKNLFL